MLIEQILLYISTATDLVLERETISRAISEVPVPMGWRILFSPSHGENLYLGAVKRADLHLLILGPDICAPIGVEWLAARQAGRMPGLLLKSGCLRTSAAEDFIRHVGERANWITFEHLADLRMQALILVTNHILERSEYYSLSTHEYERLKGWRGGLEISDGKPIDDRRGGAGESSVLLTTERFIPKDGVLIHGPKVNPENGEK